MLSNQIVIAALAGTCVAAAAGGGYVATRHNAAAIAPATTESAATPEAVVVPKEGTAVKDPLPVEPSQPAVERVARAPRPVAPAQPRPAAAAPRPAPAPAPEIVSVVDAAPVHSAVPAPEVRVVEARTHAPELSRGWEPPAVEEPAFRELVVPADSVVGLKIETAVSTETALVEDEVEARVVRDVRVGGEVAIPAGSRALGTVTVVERGGRFREQARLGIRFDTLVLSDGTRVPVSTEAIYRLGNAPGRASAAKIGGGAVAGAILGGILGGGKGAAIGASSGAGAGTAVVYAGDRSEASFASGLEVTARFIAEAPVIVRR